MSAPVAARSVVSMMETAARSNPLASTASAKIRAIATQLFWAMEPPRKMQALPVRMQIPAASAVTLGRASYTIATSPKGTLTRLR